MLQLSVALAILVGTVSTTQIVPPASLAPSPYQKWAHYHWVWLVNDDGNQENCTNLIDDYISNEIPVGALNIGNIHDSAKLKTNITIIK